MYDLDIFRDDGVAAAEVTFAADAETIEFWNLMNRGGRWRVDDLAGGWSVSAEPSARVKRLKADLPGSSGALSATRCAYTAEGAAGVREISLLVNSACYAPIRAGLRFPGAST
jgi:hypothetical protein